MVKLDTKLGERMVLPPQADDPSCLAVVYLPRIGYEEYQREVGRHKDEIVRKFKRCLLQTPTLATASKNGNVLVCIDGRTRITACLELEVHTCVCRIIPTKTLRERARLFLELNGGYGTVKPLNTRQKFKARLVEQDPHAEMVVRATKRAGLGIAYGGSPEWPNLVCLGTLFDLARRTNEEALVRGLKLIARTWPKQNEGLRDPFVRALVPLVNQNPHLDEGRFIEKFAKVNLNLFGNAAINSRWARVMDAVVEGFNAGLPTQSPKRINRASYAKRRGVFSAEDRSPWTE